MKVLFLTNGLSHYYNRVLSKLHHESGVELTVVIPSKGSMHLGAGVFQTREGVEFRVIEMEEARRFRFFTTFKGLAALLFRECPDVVIVLENYLRTFLLDPTIIFAMKKIRAKLILKAIPFRLKAYDEALHEIQASDASVGFAALPSRINWLLTRLGIVKFAKKAILKIDRLAYRRPNAHVNYVEAYEVWESYGISRESIFITRNSPDTDLLFKVRDDLKSSSALLTKNSFRILHVGRLVPWKRVDMLLRAFARVKTRFPDAELVVIGTGPESKVLEEMAKDLCLGSSVIFTGGVYDPHLLGKYFLASSLYVLAGMGGLSINDAMCFGLPVLCSVCDGTEKILVREGYNGAYFRDGDEDHLVEQIFHLFENVSLLPQMGLNSEKIVRNEVNIRTVINGYIKALHYVQQSRP